MCYYVYMATSNCYPAIKWDQNDPSFFVEELDPDNGLRKLFESKYAYYLGSDSGCGCGFTDGTNVLRKLREFLYNVSLKEEMIELLICALPYGSNQSVDKKTIEEMKQKKNDVNLSIFCKDDDSWWHLLKEYNQLKSK